MNFIQRYQPALSWANEFSRAFDRSRLTTQLAAPVREALHESADAWILRLDLPGYAKADVNLTLTDRTLQLVAESATEQVFSGKVERQWKLGNDIDLSGIQSRLESGVLELTLPKLPKSEPQTTRIEVN
jgi:HSP20 family protein